MVSQSIVYLLDVIDCRLVVRSRVVIHWKDCLFHWDYCWSAKCCYDEYCCLYDIRGIGFVIVE